MYGAFIGDTCGSVYEFHNLKDYDGIELFKTGCKPTDDSIMTIAVAKALMECRGCSKELTKEALIDEMHHYGSLYPDAGYGGHFYNWLKLRDRKPYNSFGNGSAMRVSSVGWLYDSIEDTLDYAKLTAEVTHNHPEGIKGAQATALAIYFARNGMDKEDIRKEIVDRFGYNLDFTIDSIRPVYKYDVTCQGTMPVALNAFFDSTDFIDAIKLALSVGGDSDTIGAITGAIAEAYYGIPGHYVNIENDILTKYENPRTMDLTRVVRDFYQFVSFV